MALMLFEISIDSEDIRIMKWVARIFNKIKRKLR